MGDVTLGLGLHIFGRGHHALGAKPTSQFLTQNSDKNASQKYKI